ncbi:hypothetical protein RRG08_010845 [Elysia crispata]|uniref:Uncharacterized protein n=1 Tax=Elysia crispata TaxID=231223 RepID=A0AAE1CLP3_9GAST|nr:hypothetical protein RRG08_010845 [Elysia crispata]
MKTQLKFMIEEFDIIFERVVNGEQPDVPDVQETPPSNFLLENQRREYEETWRDLYANREILTVATWAKR